MKLTDEEMMELYDLERLYFFDARMTKEQLEAYFALKGKKNDEGEDDEQ